MSDVKGFKFENEVHQYDYDYLTHKPVPDKTLKIEGQSADAKAVGDLIKVSATQPTTASTKVWVESQTTDVEIPTYAEHEALASEVSTLKEDLDDNVNDLKSALSFDEHLINAGMYTIQKSDLESGLWNVSVKSASTTLARTKNLFPVKSGMTIRYANTTFDTFFNVVDPNTNTVLQSIGWKTDASGWIKIVSDGYLVFVIRNHADTSATVDPADYNNTVMIADESAERGAVYAKSFVNNAVTGIINDLNYVTDWIKNAYVSNIDGAVYNSTSSAIVSASDKLICIPKGMKVHIMGASRIAKYNIDGDFISALTPDTNVTIISSEDAAFFRVGKLSTDSTVLEKHVNYRYSALEEAQNLDVKLAVSRNGVQQIGIAGTEKTGNPLVLDYCDNRRPFDTFSVSGISSGENIVICKKNIFAIRHVNGTFTKNGVTFTFNTVNHTIRIRSSTGATQTISSGFADFGDEFKTVNGTTLYHHFKFKFHTATRVAISDNPNQEVPFDFGVQMRVYDGANYTPIGTGGISILAAADTEYIVYFVIQEGWTGDITYSPQIEINDHPTAYEMFTGRKTAFISSGNENIFTCGDTMPAVFNAQNGAVKAVFDNAAKEIYLNADNRSNSNQMIYDPTKTGKINGNTWNHIFKFTPIPVDVTLVDFAANGGKYTIQKTDLESGQWSYSSKAANTTRGRCKELIPVKAGMTITYTNTTFDTYFGVLETTTSNSYIQAIGWKTDGSGTVRIDYDGYLTFIIRNHANTSATVDVDDYDSVVTIAHADMLISVRSFGNEYAKTLCAQVSDGTNDVLIADYTGEGIILNAEAGKEYGYRLFVQAKKSINAVIKPIISTGFYAVRDYGTFRGTTVVYTDKNAALTLRPHRISTLWKSEDDYDTCSSIITLTGGHLKTPFSKINTRGAMVSFIDDDTTNATFVDRYHDIFAAKGALGGYAVETINLNNNAGLADKLLSYETEGFACLYHCYHQAGDTTRYWIKGHPDYNQTLINENFMRGLREIREYGFSNYKYWVTPYGVNDKYIQDLAKNHGMQCLINCPSVYEQHGFVTPYGNVSRWNIPRIIFGNYMGNDDKIHATLQAAKVANGWTIIVSHVNSWGNNVETMGTRLSNLIQYCLDEGIEIVPFPVAFEEYRAAFLMNELF